MSLKPVQPEKLIKVLAKAGYTAIRQRGSHVILRNPEGKLTVIPVHAGEDIGVGLLNQILKETGLSREQYRALLRQV